MSSTNGAITMQEDDGEDEVTSIIKKEIEDDTTFARENNMDSIYWCWNCQHSECNQH